MSDHHTLCSPSSAWIWRICTAQPGMVRRVVNPLPRDDTASREGTAAHWAVSEQMADQVVALGQIAPNGVVLTQEMLDSADVAVRHLRGILSRATTRPVAQRTLWMENFISALQEYRGGTPDFAFYDLNAGILYVRDFKHGFEIVQAFEFWQGIEYAAHLCVKLRLPPETRVDIGIIQPRAPHRDGPVRTWRVTAGGLARYWHELDMAGEEASGPDAKLRPNAGCRRCDARHECPALQRDGYATAQQSEEALPLVLSTPALGLELVQLTEARARLDARITGLEALTEQRLRAGERVTGWALRPGESRLAWRIPPEQVIALGKLSGVDLQKPDAVITPTQAKAAKSLGKEATALIDGLSHRPPAALKLARDDGSEARRVFG